MGVETNEIIALLEDIKKNKDIFPFTEEHDMFWLVDDKTLGFHKKGYFIYRSIHNSREMIRTDFRRSSIKSWVKSNIKGHRLWKYKIINRAVRDYFLLEKNPRDLQYYDIMDCMNAEIRRKLIMRFGWNRFLKASEAEIIHTDGDSQLIKLPHVSKEDFMVVKVKDTSTSRMYILQIPPYVKTCKEAIAWTFFLEEEEYAPIVET